MSKSEVFLKQVISQIIIIKLLEECLKLKLAIATVEKYSFIDMSDQCQDKEGLLLVVEFVIN